MSFNEDNANLGDIEMNTITHGTINLDMTMHTLRRKGMEGVANLLQCLIDNKFHNMQHEVSVAISEGVEYVKWREERRVDGASQPIDQTSHPEHEESHVHDEYFGVRA